MKMTININVMQIGPCTMLVRCCTVVEYLNVRWRFDYVGDVPFLHVNKMHDAPGEAPLKKIQTMRQPVVTAAIVRIRIRSFIQLK